MNGNRKSGSRLLILALLCLLSLGSAGAWTAETVYGMERVESRGAEPRVLRVGVNVEDGAQTFSGGQGGYMADYMERLSYYAKIQDSNPVTFQFVAVPSAREMERMATAGEIDLFELTCHEESSENTMEGYSEDFLRDSFFMEEPIGESQYTLCTLPGNQELFFEDTGRLNGSVIGLTQRCEEKLLESYAASKDFRYSVRLYGKREDMEAALAAGEVKAAVISAGDLTIRRVIGYLGKTRLYLGAYGGKGEKLIESLNGLQRTLYNYEPYFDSKLAEQYSSDNRELYEAYTRQERRYIASLAPLRVAVCRDDAPNVYLDEKSNTYKGTYIELLELIGEHSGLRFEYIPALSWDECLLELKEGRVDMVLGLYGLAPLAEKWELFFSEPMMTKYIAAIGKNGSPINPEAAQTVGLTMDQSEEWVAYVREYFPQWDERFYTSEKKCFEAVSRGLVNFALIDGNSIQANKLYGRYRRVSMISSLSQQVDIVLGLPDSAPPPLKNIINKSVCSLSSSEVISCQMNYAIGYSQSLKELALAYLPYLLSGLFCILLLFALILIGAEHRKRYAEQKAVFFSNMSHEIRTPLNGIIGMTAIAQRNRHDAARVQECLDKIDYSCHHLMTIVNDVLDLSKLEKKKMQIAQDKLDLRELLHAVHAIYAMQAETAGIDYDTLVFDLTEETFAGDYTRLSQVLLNLLSNAVKFTPAGKKIRLEVTQISCGEEEAELLFRVRDEGLGIPKENLSKIFNAYEQQGAKTAGKYGGSGLGLPISRKLVELMGGCLRVMSTPGEGSAFYFTLSLKKWAGEEAPPPPSLAGMRALVLEEDPDLRRSLRGLLGSLGMEILEAVDDGRWSGLSASSKEPIACLVDCDGEGAVRRAEEVCEKFSNPRSGTAAPSPGPMSQAPPPAGSSRLRLVAFTKIAGTDAKLLGGLGCPLLEKPLMRSDLLRALAGPEPGAAAGADSEIPDLRGIRVLAAEDNAINQEIICELLRDSGCQVDVAENGEEAVKKFAESAPGAYDLILMDIQMPLMNGYDAARAIRALGREDSRAVYIAAMTADAFLEDRIKAKEAGMNQHLSKPIQLDQLYAVLSGVRGGGKHGNP